MPIRLIAADLDGTLLNSNHEVTPLTEQAIRAAMSRGVWFTIATGKTFPSTTELIKQFDIKIPVICSNGTLVHAPDGAILHEDPIPRAYATEAIQMARDAGLLSVVYAGSDLLTTTWDKNVDVLLEHHEPEPLIVPNLEAVLANEHKPHKMIFMQENNLGAVAKFQTELENAFDGRAQVLRTGLASVVELLPLGVTKGTALAFILDHLNISAQDVIALGDNCNDLDMIRQARIGVAMAHAPEDVRHSADYVTRSNDEDGVSHAIRRFVLDPQKTDAR